MNRGSSFEPQTKRQKVVAKGKHLYLDDLQDIDTGKGSFDRNYKKMLSELSKKNPNSEALKDLMEQTYPSRRQDILSGELTVVDACEKFCLLKKPNMYVNRFWWINDFCQLLYRFPKNLIESLDTGTVCELLEKYLDCSHI